MIHFNTKDIVNQKFGKLTVKDVSTLRGPKGQIKYNCICDCGNSHTVTGESLRWGKSQSCGCLKKGRPYKLQDRNEAILRNMYSNRIRKRGKKISRGLNDLSFLDFKILVLSPCFYCGCPNSSTVLDNHGGGYCITDTKLQCNGIDRVDSNQGYTKENCVSACFKCNCAKNSMSQTEFYLWLKKVYLHTSKLFLDRIPSSV